MTSVAGCLYPWACEGQGRTYANSSPPWRVAAGFACGLSGGRRPPPTADPIDAYCIEAEGRAAPSTPSPASLRGWNAYRCALSIDRGDRQRLRSRASRRRVDRCPAAGAGLPLAAPLREPAGCGDIAPDRRPVCRGQTAGTGPQPALPPDGRQAVDRFLMARACGVRSTASQGLSRSLRRRRSTARRGATGTGGPVACAGTCAMAAGCGRIAVAGTVRRPRQRLRLRRRSG